MDEKVLGYILNDIKIEALRKAIHKANRRTTTLALITALYLAGFKVCIDAQNAKIKKLSKEIDELKNEKGE